MEHLVGSRHPSRALAGFEDDRDARCEERVRVIHRLYVDVRLGGIAGVPTLADELAGAHPLTRTYEQ
jgi:hypothetical protein